MCCYFPKWCTDSIGNADGTASLLLVLLSILLLNIFHAFLQDTFEAIVAPCEEHDIVGFDRASPCMIRERFEIDSNVT